MNASLQHLISLASKVRMTDQQQEEQRRSFAYGTTHIENETVTRDMVDRAADKLKSGQNVEPAQRSR
ncbi:hypothetical protein [Salinarimonas ramus]|uniref:Uncharacterized protein n=1 Tax=Salinarimonas ramus TaxID=690164 RepID=A0A917QHE9_9HYPH|nr:hypothetical protein [Salinarimonas ramus]GGK49963.1 hypothetical protein GCM10011322_41270 [Salinarimonas ramus]